MSIRMKFTLIISIIFIFILYTNAKPKEPNLVPYTLLEQGENVIPEKRNIEIEILTSQTSFEDFYGMIHKGNVPKPPPPEVDFTESAILFISYGEQKTAGYSINVRSVFKKNGTLIVKAVLISPPQDVFTAQVITNPYVLLTVPAGDYSRVELRNNIGEVLDFKNL
jgi:hypothetical protein